jgi:site-specific DNA-methyltransferase (adenine-specific)
MFNKAQKMIEEQKPNNSTETAILPMQCYVQPFWKHSDIEIYNESNLETMKRMPDNCIDLTVTSPPYDDLRTYNGYCFDFENVAKELFRVTKKGGVVVWNVNDATKNGSETLTSFRQVLFFNQIGFNVETMIWEKTGSGCLGSNKFYGQNFEYMFILTKGMPKTTNLICDRENKVKSGTVKVNGGLDKTGKGKDRIVERKPFGKRNNIWRFDTQKNSEHPAPYPEQLATDHILSWSNEGDVIYDPFGGSGTTCKMAYLSNRKSIMSEISVEYCELSKQRLSEHLPKGLFA